MEYYLQQLPSLPDELRVLLMLLVAVTVLRVGGKKSLGEMTVTEAVLRISLGTILMQPLGYQKEWSAIYISVLFVIGIVLLAKLQIWFPKMRRFIIGVPSVLIKDGKLMIEEIKKARLTTDEVEIALRQQQIGSTEDVELAILESSGKFSATLKPNKQPSTKEDIQNILDILHTYGMQSTSSKAKPQTAPLFQEAYSEATQERYKPEIR